MTTNQMPKSETQEVPLSNGETVVIKPFLAPDLMFNKTVADSLAALPVLMKEYALASGATDVGVPELIAVCREPLFALVREAVKQPASWYDDKGLDDLVALAAAVFAVNMSKYEGKVVQALGRLTQSLALASVSQK